MLEQNSVSFSFSFHYSLNGSVCKTALLCTSEKTFTHFFFSVCVRIHYTPFISSRFPPPPILPTQKKSSEHNEQVFEKEGGNWRVAGRGGRRRLLPLKEGEIRKREAVTRKCLQHLLELENRGWVKREPLP